MSHQYYNPNYPPNQIPVGGNFPINSSTPQFQPVNLHPQYHIPPPAIVPSQQVVQLVPVPVPVHDSGHGGIHSSGQYTQSIPLYSVQSVSDPPREKRNRKSEELNYYLGNDRSRNSNRTRSRSRSVERYTGDWDNSGRPHSRNSDYNRRPRSRSDMEYQRWSRSPVDNRTSRSPEGSRHSRHSASHRQSGRSSSHRRSDSPHGYSQEYYRENRDDFDSRERRNEYSDSRDNYRNENRDKNYREHEYTNQERDSHRQRYEEGNSDRFMSSSSHSGYTGRQLHDKYVEDNRYCEERRRNEWNESKNVLEGKSRRPDYDREDYDEPKRRKYDTDYYREGRSSRDSSYDRGDYSSDRDTRSRSRYEREDYSNVDQGQWRRDDRCERQTKYGKEFERETDYDRTYERHAGYDKDSDRNFDRHSDYDRTRNKQREFVSDNHSDKSGSRLKIHVDNKGRWIETNKDASPVSDKDTGVNWSRDRDRYDRGEGYKNDLNITIENERAYDGHYDSRAADDRRTDHTDYERDQPERFTDRGDTRYDRADDHRSNSENENFRYDKQRYHEDNSKESRNYDKREGPSGRSDYPIHSYEPRPKRYDTDNISESESISHVSNRSNRSYRNHSRNLSPVSQEERYERDKTSVSSRTSAPFHAQSRERPSTNASNYPRNRNSQPGTSHSFPRSNIDFDVPLICLDFSSKTGCQDPKCVNWHVCRHFVEDKCEFGDSCKRGHNFFVGGIYYALFEYNKKSINFKQMNKMDIHNKIMFKLREQLKKRAKQVNEENTKASEVDIDPEFDASNYDESGNFIKKPEEESTVKSDKTGKSDEEKLSDKESVKTDLKTKVSDREIEPTEKSKVVETNESNKANEKVETVKAGEKSQANKADEQSQTNKAIRAGSSKGKGETLAKECEEKNIVKNEKDRSGSLSPVSVENIENWEEYERYERVSEGGLSDTEEDKRKKDELENVSSDEEFHTDEYPFSHHNILAKAAVPIGMNDPLVFNPSKNAPPGSVNVSSEPERMNVPLAFNPSTRPPPIVHMPATPVRIHPPLVFNPSQRPPPVPQLAGGPLFPSARTMGAPVPNTQNMPFLPPGQIHPVNIPPPQIPPPQVPPPQIPPVNYLPSPNILQEVIQSLQESQTKKVNTKTKVQKRKSGEDLDSLAEKNPELNEVIQTPWQFPHKGVLNMTVIEFVTETEAYKEEFVAELMRILITLDLPYVTMKKLITVIREKMAINVKSPVDMRKILAMYPECFQIIETLESDDEDESSENVRKNVQIKAKVSLGFCDRHGYLPFAVGKCDCNALHICKFYFLTSCPYERCKFGHKLKTNHNMTVFRSHKLHRMTGKEVMTFVRDVDNRHVEMVPEVCRFYNREKGECYKGDIVDPDVICHKLHLCQFYAKGNCFKNPCPRSHNVRDKQPFTLLQMYGLDPNFVGEEKLLNMLHDVMSEMGKKRLARNAPFQSNKKGDVDQTGNRQEESATDCALSTLTKTPENNQREKSDKSESKTETKMRKLDIKLPTVCKFYNNELGCKKRDWGPSGYCMFVHVCQNFVTGDCKFGDKCKRSHDLISGPAGTLLQKHGLDTSLYTSREIADVLNNPDEALVPVRSDKSQAKVDVKVEPKRESGTVSTSSKKVEAAYKSYSVEDILEQIIERGKEEERKKAEQMKNEGTVEKVLESGKDLKSEH